ncbi:hypothetical protein EVJ58_g9662 [Rhodofomes roseus]|uniref:Uncharacterized protein n=1 Tax=Rhodofomes roseus TaxID=34475 RepID=A0A4Y9XRW1_9APHY|nr:hypothetical protein EVJ58_g9662 [Rhodofomes roseus]
MAGPTPSSSTAPRFRSSLWFPLDYGTLPPRIQPRNTAWQLYVAHRAVRVATALGNGDYAVSPNADFVPPSPPNQLEREDIFSDGRRGAFEPGYHPQWWNAAQGHWPFMYEVPSGEEGADPAYVTLELGGKEKRGTFLVINRQTGKGSPMDDFTRALQDLYEAEVGRAESFLHRDHNPPSSLVLRPAVIRDKVYRLPVELTDLYTARKNVAVIQHHLLELRSYSYRAYLQESLDSGRMSIPCTGTTGVGCWIREGDDELLKRLAWFGVRVWYVRRSPTPSPSVLRPVQGFDVRLSLEGWDDEVDAPKQKIGKKKRKYLEELEAELRAEEDSDFDWDDPSDGPLPINQFRAGPSKPLGTPAANPTAVSPANVMSAFPDPEEEGWNNSPAIEQMAPSSPIRRSPSPRRSEPRTPPRRADTPMVISPEPLVQPAERKAKVERSRPLADLFPLVTAADAPRLHPVTIVARPRRTAVAFVPLPRRTASLVALLAPAPGDGVDSTNDATIVSRPRVDGTRQSDTNPGDPTASHHLLGASTATFHDRLRETTLAEYSLSGKDRAPRPEDVREVPYRRLEDHPSNKVGALPSRQCQRLARKANRQECALLYRAGWHRHRRYRPQRSEL